MYSFLDWPIEMIVYDTNYTVYNDQSMNQGREKERRVCALTPGTEGKQTRSRKIEPLDLYCDCCVTTSINRTPT